MEIMTNNHHGKKGTAFHTFYISVEGRLLEGRPERERGLMMCLGGGSPFLMRWLPYTFDAWLVDAREMMCVPTRGQRQQMVNVT